MEKGLQVLLIVLLLVAWTVLNFYIVDLINNKNKPLQCKYYQIKVCESNIGIVGIIPFVTPNQCYCKFSK